MPTNNTTDNKSQVPRGLSYVDSQDGGVSRRRVGDDFTYVWANGEPVKRDDILDRISRLAIPPAYADVWICADENGHLQATGVDEKGRKQYLYHPEWRVFRDRQKFDHLPDFGRHLSRLRRRARRDLNRDIPDKTFACAALVRLLDKTAIRVGHKSYVKSANTFGATTLREKHISLSGESIHIDFRGKRGKRVQISIKDTTLNAVLETIDDLPGKRIFQYVGMDGDIYPLDSYDVNDYIGEAFTAKTFRTWHGSVAAFTCALKHSDTPTIKALCEAAAKRLCNTPAICRSSYVHPAVIDLADDDNAAILTGLRHHKLPKRTGALRRNEAVFLHYLETFEG